MSQKGADLFTRLAPVLNVRDLAAERAFYESLGLPVVYEGPEYPEFIGFGTETVHFGIQKAAAGNDPPSVLTWQIGVTDIDAAIERCRSAGSSPQTSWPAARRCRSGCQSAVACRRTSCVRCGCCRPRPARCCCSHRRRRAMIPPRCGGRQRCLAWHPMPPIPR
jgi:hypothetical protein